MPIDNPVGVSYSNLTVGIYVLHPTLIPPMASSDFSASDGDDGSDTEEEGPPSAQELLHKLSNERTAIDYTHMGDRCRGGNIVRINRRTATVTIADPSGSINIRCTDITNITQAGSLSNIKARVGGGYHVHWRIPHSHPPGFVEDVTDVEDFPRLVQLTRLKIINCITKMASPHEGAYRVHWAMPGDRGNHQPNHAGFIFTDFAGFQQLVQAVDITKEYQSMVQQAALGVRCWPPVGAKDSSTGEAMAGQRRCVRVSLRPYGRCLPQELISPDRGCAFVSILVTLAFAPGTLTLDLQAVEQIALSAQEVAVSIYPNKPAGIFHMTFGEILEVFKNPELKCSLREAYNVGCLQGRSLTEATEEKDGDSTEIPAREIPVASRETRPTPKSRSLSIGRLIAKGPGTAFGIRTRQRDGDITHCIALLNPRDGSSTFVDSSRPGFYKATPESYADLGYEAVSESWQFWWQPAKTSNAKGGVGH